MLILLPPSEGKTAPLRGKPLELSTLVAPSLNPTRQRLIDSLMALSRHPSAATVLKISATNTELLDRNAALMEAPSARADAVYTGVLYDALDVASLSTSARRRAAGRVLITSALWGVVSPTDRIPPYRLSGDVTLPDLGPVAGCWREPLAQAIPELLGSGLLVDLRSGTYANLWRPEPALSKSTATLRVLQEAGGRRTVVSHLNKATKGRIVRALLEDGANPRTPGRLADLLRDLGWRVETGEPTAKGTTLDVIVDSL